MDTKQEQTANTSSRDETIAPSTIMHNAHAVYPSFAMLAAMQLDVFTPLKDGPMQAGTLATALDVQEDKLTPLLYSLAASGLLKMERDLFSNTAETDKFLVRGRPDYIGGLSGFYSKVWHAAMNTAESIRTGKPKQKIDWHALPENELLFFFQSQFHSSIRAGKELADRLDFSEFERLLDAGGGTGGVSIGICKKFPRIRATVADLPKVTDITGQFIAEAGMSDRIRVSPTDLCLNSPDGQYDLRYDLAILRALIQTLSKEQAQKVIKHIGQSMVPGGQIYIFGSILENSRLSPLSSLGAGLVFLNVYDDGKAYTENEHREMLLNAGFADITVEHEALVDGMGIVSARKQ
ncbi:MAG: hypothetical protein HY881_28405 [Deltaproteobacteria bacterium]|nr:hypothetical protein [Deltaproteobacteria bacterium]